MMAQVAHNKQGLFVALQVFRPCLVNNLQVEKEIFFSSVALRRKHKLRRPNLDLRKLLDGGAAQIPSAAWRRRSRRGGRLLLSAAALPLVCWSLAGFKRGV